MSIPTTSQFKSATTPSGKKAFEAWCAIYTNFDHNVMIAAPTIDGLKTAYKQFTERELIAEAAQHVWIVAFSTLEDAPSTKPAPANIPCSVKDCKTLASFIVNRKAFCMEHKR